jgi:serine/threonine protein kinase
MLPQSNKQKTKENPQSQKKSQLTDYKVIKNIGEGAFGEVFLVKHVPTEKTFALKSIDKIFLAKQKKEHHVFQEKLILQSLNYPYVVKLFSTFQDAEKLYFLLENVPNGELAHYLRSKSLLIRKSSHQRGKIYYS